MPKSVVLTWNEFQELNEAAGISAQIDANLEARIKQLEAALADEKLTYDDLEKEYNKLENVTEKLRSRFILLDEENALNRARAMAVEQLEAEVTDYYAKNVRSNRIIENLQTTLKELRAENARLKIHNPLLINPYVIGGPIPGSGSGSIDTAPPYPVTWNQGKDLENEGPGSTPKWTSRLDNDEL